METIEKENFQCCFVNTKQNPIKSTHISYFVKKDINTEEKLNVFEVVNEIYPHPNCINQNEPEIVINLITYHHVLTILSNEIGGAGIYAHFMQEKSLKEQVKSILDKRKLKES